MSFVVGIMISSSSLGQTLDICSKEHYFWPCLVSVLSGPPKPTDCFALSRPVGRAHYQHPPSPLCADPVGLCPLVRTPLGLRSPSAPGLSPFTGKPHSCCSLALLWGNWNAHHPLSLSEMDPHKAPLFSKMSSRLAGLWHGVERMTSKRCPLKDVPLCQF